MGGKCGASKELQRPQKLDAVNQTTLETQIENDEDMLSNAQTKLGFATEKEATAGETARQTAAENDQLE